MRTRRGNYPSPTDGIIFSIRPSYSPKRQRQGAGMDSSQERPCKFSRLATSRKSSVSFNFDLLPDDLLVDIAMALASTVTSSADLINMMLVCRRFCAAATHPQVLAKASPQAFAVKASSWSPGVHRFLKQCADAGNVEALYTLGMIRFYCLNNSSGASLMAKAAMASHAPALHSLAVIQFNGSGGRRKDKDLKAGVALCLRAAFLGHVDAIRELGHCLQDGYGVAKNVYEGRRLLLEANTREALAAFPKSFMELALNRSSSAHRGVLCPHHRLLALPPPATTNNNNTTNSATTTSATNNTTTTTTTTTTNNNTINNVVNNDSVAKGPPKESEQQQNQQQQQQVSADQQRHPVFKLIQHSGCALLSDFGCNVPPLKVHVANKFLVDWFTLYPPESGLRLCSHANCGRPETRRHEFRRCSACNRVNYCSRACQALDWKLRHKHHCRVENGGGAVGEEAPGQVVNEAEVAMEEES